MLSIVLDDSLDGRGISIVPTSEKYDKVIIWFHGLGDTAEGWSKILPQLNIPNTKYIVPTAPIRPIKMYGNMPLPSWSNVIGLGKSFEEDREGFDNSTHRINRIIESELAAGILSKNILIGGYSQGGALALHITLRSRWILGGCVVLSGWLPFKDDYPAALSQSAKSIPILQSHGDADQVVSFDWGVSSFQLIQKYVRNPLPSFVVIEGMNHSTDPEQMKQVKLFIKEQLSS